MFRFLQVTIGMIGVMSIFYGCQTSHNIYTDASIMQRHHRPGYYVEWSPLSSSHSNSASPGNNQQVSAISAVNSISPRSFPSSQAIQIPQVITYPETRSTPSLSPPLTQATQDTLENTTISRFSPIRSPNPVNVPPENKQTNSMALVGFIFSLLGLFLFGVSAIIGLAFSYVGKKQINNQPDLFKGMGWAKAGVTIGWIALVPWSLWLGLIAAFGTSLGATIIAVSAGLIALVSFVMFIVSLFQL